MAGAQSATHKFFFTSSLDWSGSNSRASRLSLLVGSRVSEACVDLLSQRRFRIALL
jgi:hypothetical protein